MEKLIASQTSELALTKAEVAKLRGLDLGRVAKALDYDGPLESHRNAIDLVKAVGGMEYAQAIAWLNAEFGQDAAQAAASAYGRDAATEIVRRKIPVPPTTQQIVKQERVTEQLAALGAEQYRITMMSDLHPTYNVGKGKGPEGTEKFYTAVEIAAMVPQLEKKNQKEKYNVFVTPVDKTQHFVLVDDLTPATLAAMRADGYKPNLVMESSKNNMQAVFTVKKTAMSKEVGNAVFKGLNTQFGDKNIQGFVHPFRLAGFANVKDKHRDAATGHYPFVRLIEQAKATCGRIIEFARLIAEQTVKPHMTDETAAKQVRQVLTDKAALAALISDPSGAAPAALRQMAATHYQHCEWRWGADMNRSVADFMFIKRALASGYKVEQIASTLSIQSPDLATRHPDVAAYVAKSIDAAVAAERPSRSPTYSP